MATGEEVEQPQKDDNKDAHSEEQVKKATSNDVRDKGIEAKDAKKSGETDESKKKEDVNGKVVVEEKKNNNEVEKNEPSKDVEDEGFEIKGVKSTGEDGGVTKKKEDAIEKVVEEKKKSEGEGTREIAEEAAVLEEKKNGDHVEKGDDYSGVAKVEKNSSLREESNFLSELKEHEKWALMELRSKVENAILKNKLLKERKNQVVVYEKEKISKKEDGENDKLIKNDVKEGGKEIENSTKVEKIEGKEKKLENAKASEEKGEEKAVKETEKVEEKLVANEEKEDGDENKVVEQEDEEKQKEDEERKKLKNNVSIDKDISIWGIPLLPSKEDSGTNVILLKFLRAREFEVIDAFEMLRNTLQWRKDKNVDSILDEDFGEDLGSIGQMNSIGREGHPVCYSNFKLLGDEAIYNKILGTEENREMFIRRRVQIMEKAIQKLDFTPGGVSSILLVNDLKDMPGPSKKELRLATKQVVGILQNNYPEFVARNIFINVPFWYYAYSASALLFPFLTPRTNSKAVFARPARVTDVLLKYVSAEEIPVHYGGLKRENDSEFSTEDAVLEIVVNPSTSESIHIPALEAGTTLIWEITVLGWEVNYKEEFFPVDEGSYGIIVQKSRRVGWQAAPLRNSFTNNEAGNVVLTVENGSIMKKKRVCYRYKIKN